MSAVRAGPAVTGALAVETAIARVVEVFAAALVLADIVILFAGVVSRYALDSPITWSDELAATLFLWMVMLGSVVALHRGEHMRLALGSNWTGTAWERRLAAFGILVTLVFVGTIIWPAWRYQMDQAAIETPALGVSGQWRALSLPVGFGLILVLSLCRLVVRCTMRDVLGVAGTMALVTAGLWLMRPALLAVGNYNLLVFFVLLAGSCVLSGVPIAFAFGISTVAYLGMATRVPMSIVISRMDEGMSSLVLLAVPLFVALGLLMEMTGLARVLVAFLVALCGHVRGGLSYVLLGAMYLVSGISGAKAADMAAVAPVLFPEMKRRGTPEGDLIALLAASAAMSETIPPSLVLIMIGSVTGVSISALFAGGMLPALVVAGVLTVLCWWRSRREDVSSLRRAPLGVIGRTLIVAIPALLLPVLIRAAVVDGVATATEVSTVGIAYCLVAGLVVYRQFNWRRVMPILVETASLSGAILLIIGAATAMAWALTRSGFSQLIVQTVLDAPGGQTGFLLVSILLFGILGSVLEGIPVIVLFGPLLFPAARAIHLNEVHYAMVAILAMGIGLFAPPFGVGFYAACAIGKVDPSIAVSRVLPYIGALIVGLLIVAAVPWFSTAFL